MIAIVNYNMGNIGSITNALDYLNIEYVVTSNREEILAADKLILPGVGAFRDAINLLEEKGLDVTIKEFAKTNKPVLGICLGFQLLLSKSFEFGIYKGLNLIDGDITLMKSDTHKIPHIGWNEIKVSEECPIFKNILSNSFVYFVHSYALMDTDNVYASAKTTYHKEFVSAVWKDNIYGVQFHPEKSGEAGLKILKNFGGL